MGLNQIIFLAHLIHWKPLGWWMSCENPTLPAEAGGLAGEQRPVLSYRSLQFFVCSFLECLD